MANYPTEKALPSGAVGSTLFARWWEQASSGSRKSLVSSLCRKGRFLARGMMEEYACCYHSTSTSTATLESINHNWCCFLTGIRSSTNTQVHSAARRLARSGVDYWHWGCDQLHGQTGGQSSVLIRSALGRLQSWGRRRRRGGGARAVLWLTISFCDASRCVYVSLHTCRWPRYTVLEMGCKADDWQATRPSGKRLMGMLGWRWFTSFTRLATPTSPPFPRHTHPAHNPDRTHHPCPMSLSPVALIC
jgi:hypothetical protein